MIDNFPYQDSDQYILEAKTMDALKDYLSGVTDNLYSNDDLNHEQLNHCVEELCALLEAPFPETELTIERKVPRD